MAAREQSEKGQRADLIPNNLQIVFSFYRHWAVMCARLIVCQTRNSLGGEVLISKREKVTARRLVKRTMMEYQEEIKRTYRTRAKQRTPCVLKKSFMQPKSRPPHTARPQRWKKRARRTTAFFHFPSLPSLSQPPVVLFAAHIHTRTSVCVTFCAMCEYPVAAAKKRKDRRTGGRVGVRSGPCQNIRAVLSRARQLSVIFSLNASGPDLQKMQSPPRVSTLAHT